MFRSAALPRRFSSAHETRQLTRRTGIASTREFPYNRMCWFHALRITSLSRKLNLPSFRPRIVFSAVTNRSSRTTEGFANPASLQSEMTASSGPDAVADVIRQISTSWPQIEQNQDRTRLAECAGSKWKPTDEDFTKHTGRV